MPSKPPSPREAALRELVERLVEAGVERWHTVVNDEPALHSWLGLTWEEYRELVQPSPAIQK